MRRFWIKFEEMIPFSPLNIGCGITAFDYDDAIALLHDRVLKGRDLKVGAVVADIDVRSLDAGHVLPNMGNVMARGVWFPMGYD
jgi:hypothetical protein